MTAWKDRVDAEETVEFHRRLQRFGKSNRKQPRTIPEAVATWSFLERSSLEELAEYGITRAIEFYFLLVRCPYCGLQHGHSWNGKQRFIPHRQSHCFNHIKPDGELFTAEVNPGYNVVLPKDLRVIVGLTPRG